MGNEYKDGIKKTVDNLLFYQNLAGIMRRETRRFVFVMTKHSPLRRTSWVIIARFPGCFQKILHIANCKLNKNHHLTAEIKFWSILSRHQDPSRPSEQVPWSGVQFGLKSREWLSNRTAATELDSDLLTIAIADRIGRHDVLLPIYHNHYNFPQKLQVSFEKPLLIVISEYDN